MANINLTSFFSLLDDWPGRLLEARTGTDVLTRTAQKFAFQYPDDGSAFANFRVEANGTGFSYNAGEPVAGRMSQVRIFDGAGNLLISFNNLGNDPITSA
jgi:hypothetical protein